MLKAAQKYYEQIRRDSLITEEKNDMSRKQKQVLIRIIASAVMLVLLYFIPVKGAAELLLYSVPYLVIGYDILIKACKGVAHGQPFDENFLMAVATVGAVILGEYTEGVAVMLFYQIGELFQSYAVGKSRRNIGALMDIRPDRAYIESADGALTAVEPDEVETGTVIVVSPGERIPIDGIIVEGSASVDTGALTGESVPRTLSAGDEVISGCIDLTGVIHVKTTRPFGESTVSKILELVGDAGTKKSRPEAFISRFARIYTPVVCAAALVLAVFPPLVRMLMLGISPEWSKWVYRALTFLVISCPCALVISIPLTFFAGIGGSGKAGILIKGSGYMETLSKIKTVVFDKTGTMTQGVFEVAGIHHGAIDNDRILEYAALAESFSNHPISGSLRRAYGKPLDRSRVADTKEIGGHGITARVDGDEVAVGNAKLMELLGIEYTECGHAGTVIHVAVGGSYVGHILITDMLKPNAAKAVKALKAAGVSKTVMLTGDRASAANQAAEMLGIDEVMSELLPSDKVEKVEALLSVSDSGSKLAFVGDGINDAPVLARADVGIAMGALGSDAAIEAADVVLMDDDPMKIAVAIKHARKCIGIVYENIYFAIGIKLVCLLLGAIGIAGMWTAVFADVGVMVLAVFNAVRALGVKKATEMKGTVDNG